MGFSHCGVPPTGNADDRRNQTCVGLCAGYDVWLVPASPNWLHSPRDSLSVPSINSATLENVKFLDAASWMSFLTLRECPFHVPNEEFETHRMIIPVSPYVSVLFSIGPF